MGKGRGERKDKSSSWNTVVNPTSMEKKKKISALNDGFGGRG